MVTTELTNSDLESNTDIRDDRPPNKRLDSWKNLKIGFNLLNT